MSTFSGLWDFIWTNIDPSMIFSSLLRCWKRLVSSKVSSYVNSHNLYNTFHTAYRPAHSTNAALLKVDSDLFLSCNKDSTSLLDLIDVFLHLTRLIIQSMNTVSIMTLSLLILSFNGFHLIWKIFHSMSLRIIVVLLFLLRIQVFLRDLLLDLYFSPCMLILCLPLLNPTPSHTIHLLMTYNYICLLLMTKYPNYFTSCSHA